MDTNLHPVALDLPLSAGSYLDKLQDQRLDRLELHRAMELKWKLENAGSTGETSCAESTNR